MKNIWILAAADSEGDVIGMEDTSSQEVQTTTQQDGTNGMPDEGTPKEKPNMLMQFGPIILIFIVMYFLMFRGPKKKQQEHKKMVAAMAKNDRIRTIGGIFGTILDVRDDEIVIKIDESTNAKMRISPSAVATVLKDGKNE